MEKEEIDEFAKDYKSIWQTENQEKLHKFFEKYLKIYIQENIEIINEKKKEYFKKVMLSIEDKNFDYFLTLAADGKHLELSNLLEYCSKTDSVKLIMQNADKLRLSSNTITDLVIATNDAEYIKSYIDDREKLKLNIEKIVNLIIATKDVNYIEQCIENRKEMRLKPINICTLIKETHDIEYIKNCVTNRKNLGLYDITDLIIATNDVKYIKSCIDDRENLGLGTTEVIDLIKATKQSFYIKSCIENRNKLGISLDRIIPLIKATEDADYIKTCIKNREAFRLRSKDIRELIQDMQDKNYTKNCISNWQNIGLNIEDVINLIEETYDVDYIKECVKNSKKLNLGQDDILELIREIKNPNYVKENIENIEKLNIDNSILLKILFLTGDIKFIAKYAEKMNLGPEDIKTLQPFISKARIKLPPNMTIGIEIETEGGLQDNSDKIEAFLTAKEWKVKEDTSLTRGTEVVSPKFTEDTKEASNEIKGVCALLDGVGQKASVRCGGHVHIGADYLDSKQDWVNLIEIWSNAEKVLYAMCNEEGNIPREGVLEYANPISKKIDEAIKKETINLETEEEASEFVKKVAKIQGERRFSINFQNIGNEEKNTVEFRISNGTKNPDIWIQNINLFGGMVKRAHELTIIQAKPVEKMKENEIQLLENFERLKTEENEEQIAKALIYLCSDPEDRPIYMKRYITNSKLLEESPDLKNALTMQITTNKIGRKVFNGEGALTGEDYKRGITIIEQAIKSIDDDKTK